MEQVELITSLLVVIAVVGAIAQRLRFSLPIALVLVGMIISLIPAIPDVNLAPDTVFFIFLPPLLYVESFNTPWRELKDVGEVITFQAIVLVLITVGAVGLAIHSVVPGIPWAVALAFGAIVSPTDAVAATAISKDVVLPKKLMDVIKGESLVNDATSLVAYQFAVAAAVTGMFSLSAAAGRFVFVALGGISIGLALGWVLARIRTRLDHRPVEVTVSLLSPFIAYLTAEHLHVSGVLSVVSAGLLLGWRGPSMFTSQARLQSIATWETIVYVINGFSFLLMGLQLEPILETVKTYPAGDLVIWALTAACAPILVRFLCIYSTSPLYALLKRRRKPRWKQLFILSWSGMRGVVSLAAALSLPVVTASGQPFPYRDLLVFFTVIVIASTLIFQGLTLPWIVRKFALEPDVYDAEAAEHRARMLLAREAVRKMDEVVRLNKIDIEDPTVQNMMHRYLEQAVANAHPDSKELLKSSMWRRLKADIIESQRRLLISMRDTHQIENDLFRILQNDLDIEESQLI